MHVDLGKRASKKDLGRGRGESETGIFNAGLESIPYLLKTGSHNSEESGGVNQEMRWVT